MRFLLISFLFILVTSPAVCAPPAPLKKIARLNKSPTRTELVAHLSDWQEEIRDLEELSDKRVRAKADFVYRLRFLVERRYDGSEASLLRILKFMKELDGRPQPGELAAATVEEKRFIDQLIKAVEEVRERHEPLWVFVKTFTDSTSLGSIDLEEFAKGRDYINNYEAVPARILSKNDVDELFTEMEAKTEVLKEKTSTAADDGL